MAASGKGALVYLYCTRHPPHPVRSLPTGPPRLPPCGGGVSLWAPVEARARCLDLGNYQIYR